MKPTIEVIETKLFNGVVADEIVASIRDSISERGRCAIALAGGSTPSAIYRLLARPPRVGDVEWENIDIYWGDERWVPLDHVHSNFRMTNETLLSQIPKPGPRVHPVNTAAATPQIGAKEYGTLIREIEGAQPVFDIVLLGIGEDGHIASIFPQSEILRECPDICVAVDHPDGSQRVTLSPQLLFAGKRIIFIVKGENKAGIMEQVLDSSTSVSDIPARLYNEVASRVTFFLDSAAATKVG